MSSRLEKRYSRLKYGLLLLATVGVLFALAAPLKLVGWMPPFGPRAGIAAAVLGVVLSVALQVYRRPAERGGSLVIAAVALLLIVVSDVPNRSFTYFLNEASRADIFFAGLLGVYAARRGWFRAIPPFLLLTIVCFTLSVVFVRYADGRLIFSDDHPAFLYRLLLLKDHLTSIPFYNTDWNAGYPTTEIIPTGTLSLLMLTFPILYWGPTFSTVQSSAVYTLIVPYLCFWIMPLSVYFGCRLLKFSRWQSAVSSILVLAPTMELFEWGLKFGTMGFFIAVALFPITWALSFRVALLPSLRWYHGAILVVVSTVCLSWAMIGIAFFPLVGVAVWRWKRVFSRDRRIVLAAVVAALVLTQAVKLSYVLSSPVIQAALTGHARAGTEGDLGSGGEPIDGGVVESHVEGKESPKTAANFGERFRKQLAEVLVKVNPVVLVCGFLGLFRLRHNDLRLALFATALWLLFLVGVGDSYKPQLELSRMSLPLAVLLVVPAGATVVQLFRALLALRSRPAALVGGALSIVPMGLLLLTPIHAGSVYLNRSYERYTFAPPLVQNLANAIREHGGDGRTFFLGFMLQELGPNIYGPQDGGHLAILAHLSGKPLYSFDYYQRLWRAIDPIPKSYRDRDQPGIEEFLDIVNATAVVALDGVWNDYCSSSRRYKLVFRQDRFSLYTRQPAPEGYFLKGKGTLSQTKSEVTVVPETEEAIIKYRFVDGLTVASSIPAEIFPVHAFDEDRGAKTPVPVYYIGLRVPPSAVEKKVPVTIRLK